MELHKKVYIKTSQFKRELKALHIARAVIYYVTDFGVRSQTYSTLLPKRSWL